MEKEKQNKTRRPRITPAEEILIAQVRELSAYELACIVQGCCNVKIIGRSEKIISFAELLKQAWKSA